MKMRTSELQGAALDWAVATCEGGYDERDFIVRGYKYTTPNYSTDWAQGGPIIERECINLFRLDPKTEDDTRFWLAHIDGIYCRYGVSAIVAAMRCYVAMKLGDEVEIPEELK
jgi:hypothetical protein